MMQQLEYWWNNRHIGGAVQDYTLAGALTTSPVWGYYLSDINGWLTFVGLVFGVVLAGRRLWRDFHRPSND